MELTQILKGIELFRGLDSDQFARIAEISHQENYATDDKIVEQGSTGDKMYVIADGQVEVRVDDGHGGYHSTVYLGRGQIFGEMALLDQGQRSATVVACEDGTVVYGISNHDFNTLCMADTAIGYIMMRNLAIDLSFKLRHQNLDPSSGVM
jgi:CRP-like cAMP-binding protein